MIHDFDPAALGKYDGAAAGHEGTLSNASGTIFAKPCTAEEVAFYEETANSHPDLAYFMPQFLGTLQLNQSASGQEVPLSGDGTANLPEAAVESLRALNLPLSHLPSSSELSADPLPPFNGLQRVALPPSLSLSSSTPPNLKSPDTEGNSSRLWGKKLDTDLHIVLSNISAGFKQPNIMDLKLGSRLWDEKAKPDKRARLDKVASETTSGDLGIRIAGMRVWCGQKKKTAISSLEEVLQITEDHADAQYTHLDDVSNVRSFDKLYGRQFNAENIISAFKEFLLVPSAGVDEEQASAVAQCFLADVQELQQVLEEKESRMYSASILLVYEGDPAAFRKAVELANERAKIGLENEEGEDNEYDGNDSDDDVVPVPYAVKLIDFAHAKFLPGAGPDENLLKGVRSTVTLLERLVKEFGR